METPTSDTDPSNFSFTTLRAAVRILEQRANALLDRVKGTPDASKFGEVLVTLLTRAAIADAPFGWKDEPALAVNYAAAYLAAHPQVTIVAGEELSFDATNDVYKAYTSALARIAAPPPPTAHDGLIDDLLA